MATEFKTFYREFPQKFSLNIIIKLSIFPYLQRIRSGRGKSVDVIKNPEETVDRHGILVYRLALAQTKNPDDAEDVFQEVFLRLVRSRQSFDSDEHLKAWLIRVTVNCSRSFWRSVLRRGEISLGIKDFPGQNVQTTDEHSEVYDKVMHLPSKYRAVIHLYYYECMPIEDIGTALKIGYSAAARRLSRARKLLKQELMEGEYNEGHSGRILESCQHAAHSK